VLALVIYADFSLAISALGKFILALLESIKMMFTGKVGVNDLTGPVGISSMISVTKSFKEYMYMMSIISVSLGITNLLPIPALDGGKIVLLLIEAIRKKPLSEKIEVELQLIGFSILIVLSIFVTYHDISRLMLR